MANTNFRIRRSCDAGTPAEPPLAAWPVGIAPRIEAPPTVQYPQPVALSGVGYPTGIIGRPWAEFGRPRIDEDGLDYYNALFAGTSSGSALVKVKLYDLRNTGWYIYEGVAWRPTFDMAALAGPNGPEFVNFRLRVTELEPSSW